MTQELTHLFIFKNLTEDDVIKAYKKCGDNADSCYDLSHMLIQKAEKFGLSGNLLSAYIIYLLSEGNNIAAVNIRRCGQAGRSITALLKLDMEKIFPLLDANIKIQAADEVQGIIFNYQPARSCSAEAYRELVRVMYGAQSAEQAADLLLAHYKKFGSGMLSHYRAFYWLQDKGIRGIEYFEKIRMADLIGYEKQKKILTDNTLAFLTGRPANNILLVGARGTGKSSGVKALANEYYQKGLRLMQITRDQLREIPAIMQCLRKMAGYKFIVFLDDLSFNEGEFDYKYLKSAIEGGVSSIPPNVLLYATSNRRHLIRETWNDREDTQEELYRNDSVNESISLSDRFGLIINYDAPNQNEYLAIIDHYLQQNGVKLSGEELRIAGLRWEMEHSGRSGRVARQFVNWYLGQRR